MKAGAASFDEMIFTNASAAFGSGFAPLNGTW
jgi:hypothetical protein